MAAESSFDIVNKPDRQEIDNALNQTAKELANRFDFKGVDAGIKWSGEAIELQANSDQRVTAVLDGLREGGRMVGIVSHVGELRQRIPAQVHVRKGRGGSRVVVAAG